MLTRRFKSTTPRGRLELTRPLARRAIGAIGTAAVLSAGFLVFGPFSDLSTLQLAAGPAATQGPGGAPALIVLATTGRAWGQAAQQRQAAAAASAPLARVANSDDSGLR